jgi:predicted O-methyltransferase YrrM
MDTIPVLPDSPAGPEANRKLAVQNACTYQRFEGEWAEFGTYQGQTATWMMPYLPEHGTLHLFDSYEGLARDWSALPAGSFATAPPKFTDERVLMHDGWFEDTVMDALEGRVLSFIHVDCDLYESTLDALWQLPPLREGTIILFDEYVHNLGGKPVDDEYRAFMEWTMDNNYEFRYLWRTAWTQVCVEIL